MTRNIPAIRGRFGSTEYYVATMKVGEVASTLTIPKEMRGWDDLNPEELFQREINYKRVKDNIAPYLANDPDRFIGSFIVVVKNDKGMAFECFSDAGIKIPKLLGHSFAENIGILTFSGGELLVPLDGQHRLAALKFATTGKDEKGTDITGIAANEELAEDTCTLILIRDDIEKSRKIFNKVNRYAKATSKADNLITGDDDIAAVITRDIVVKDLIGSRIVKTGASNTLSEKTPEFTTIATAYEITKSVLEFENNLAKLNVQVLPDNGSQTLYKDQVKQFWIIFLEVSAYSLSLHDPEDTGDKTRIDTRKSQVHCKPIIMRALAEAFIDLQTPDEDGARLSLAEAVGRANKVDWGFDNPAWMHVLLAPGDKVISGNVSRKFASRMLAYLLGKKLEAYELQKLKDDHERVSLGSNFPDPLF